MGKLSFGNFVPKFVAWEKSQAPGTVASAALDAESHILDSTLVEEVHKLACRTGFVGCANELLSYLGGYLLYANLLPAIENGVVVFVPPPGRELASGGGGGQFSMS